MQNSSIFSYNEPKSLYEPYELAWHDIISSYGEAAGLYGLPLSSSPEDASYDDTYYLTYEEVGDSNRRPSRGVYKENETPLNISGTCLGDYSRYFYCYSRENDEEASFERDEISREDDYKWVDTDFGDDSDDFKYTGSSDNWEETMALYATIFGH